MVFSFDVHNYPSPAAPPQADSVSASAATARRHHARDAISLLTNFTAGNDRNGNSGSKADDMLVLTASSSMKDVDGAGNAVRKGEKRPVESSSSASRSADVEASSERTEAPTSQTNRHNQRTASEYPIGYVSASVHTTLQYRDDELLGRSFLDLLSFDSRAQLGALLNDKLKAHASVIGRRRARRLALAAEQVAEVAEAAHSAQRSLETLAPHDARSTNGSSSGRRPGSSSSSNRHPPFSPSRSAVSHASVAASSSAATSRAASTSTTGASDQASVTTAASEVASLSSSAAAAMAAGDSNGSGGSSFVSSGCMSHSSSSSGLNGSGSSGQTSNKASSEDLGSDPGSEGRHPSENFLCGPTSSVGSSDQASNSAKSSGSMRSSHRSAGSSNSGSEGSGSEGSGSGNSSPQRRSSGGLRSAPSGNGEVAGRVWAGAEEPLVVDLCSHQRVQLRRRDGTVVTAHVNGVVSIAIDGSIEVVCSVRPCRDPMPSQLLGPHPSIVSQLRQVPEEAPSSSRGPKQSKSLDQARGGSLKPHASSSSSDVAGGAPGGSMLPGSGNGSSSMETDGSPSTSAVAASSSAPVVSASSAAAAAIAAAKAAAKATAKAAKYQALAEAAQAAARASAAAAEAAEEASTFSREGSVSPGSNPGSSLESGGHEGDVDSSDLTTTDPSDTDALSDSGFAADSAAIVTG